MKRACKKTTLTHRVDYVEEVMAAVQDEKVPLAERSLHTNYLLWVFVGLAVTAAFIIGLVVFDKIRSKKLEKNTPKTGNLKE